MLFYSRNLQFWPFLKMVNLPAVGFSEFLGKGLDYKNRNTVEKVLLYNKGWPCSVVILHCSVTVIERCWVSTTWWISGRRAAPHRCPSGVESSSHQKPQYKIRWWFSSRSIWRVSGGSAADQGPLSKQLHCFLRCALISGSFSSSVGWQLDKPKGFMYGYIKKCCSLLFWQTT